VNLKETILIILSYCGLRFVDKLIQDNLPDLHYKKLLKRIYYYIIPLLLTAYMGFLYLQVKVFGNKEEKNNLNNVLIVLTVTIIFYQSFKNGVLQNKKSEV
jgi:hypothetical protein